MKVKTKRKNKHENWEKEKCQIQISQKKQNKSEQGEINKTVLRTYSQIRVKLSFYLFRCLIPVSIRKKYLPLNLDTYKKWENIYKKKNFF